MPMLENDESSVLSDNISSKDVVEDAETRACNSIDEVLNELANSNFTDLNILLQWDRIKKN